MLLDDSQKLRKPKLPVYLDDPDMLFGALQTPRPTLKILQTEAQQENVSRGLGFVCGWVWRWRVGTALQRVYRGRKKPTDSYM